MIVKIEEWLDLTHTETVPLVLIWLMTEFTKIWEFFSCKGHARLHIYYLCYIFTTSVIYLLPLLYIYYLCYIFITSLIYLLPPLYIYYVCYILITSVICLLPLLYIYWPLLYIHYLCYISITSVIYRNMGDSATQHVPYMKFKAFILWFLVQ